MTLEISLFILAVLSLCTITFICRYCKFDWKFSIMLIFLSTILFWIIYHYGLNHYKINNHLKAFKSVQQVSQCGTYQQKLPLSQFLPTDEVIYQFKTDQNQIIEFNGDALTQHYYPLLQQVKKDARICFSYATDITDWSERFYLTQLSNALKNPEYSDDHL